MAHDSSPSPASAPTPDQADARVSTSTSADVDRSALNPLAVGVRGLLLGKFPRWLSRRNKRRAKYPPPFDRYFKELDFGKLCALFLGAMVTSTGTFGQQHFKLISEECMREVVLMIIFALFFLSAAYSLQDVIPEIAVLAMLGGIASVIASFHTVVLNLLDLSEKQRHWRVPIFFVGYALLLLVTLYKLFKEDVREQEEDEENGPQIAMSMV